MELDQFKLERTQEGLANLGLEVAIFSDFYNVSYLTGYTTFFENGPSPFSRNIAATIMTPDQVVLVAEATGDDASTGKWTGSHAVYTGYTFEAGAPAIENFVAALINAAQAAIPDTGKVGIERAYLPAVAWEALKEHHPNVEWIDLPVALMAQTRAVKSPLEIEKLRACARLCEVGQDAVRRAVQEPGKTEIEIYNYAKLMMEKHTGGRFALQNALHAGPSAASPFPGMPTNYVTRTGDLVITDMVPYLNGYWGDSCSTFVVGGSASVREEHRRIHTLSRDAFMMGFEMVKPGVRAGEIDERLRGYLGDHGYEYPHHTGHGVGVSNFEEPRIIIGSDTILQAGMVVLLEPPVYVSGVGGVRQERMMLVTEDDAEFMSMNSLELA